MALVKEDPDRPPRPETLQRPSFERLLLSTVPLRPSIDDLHTPEHEQKMIARMNNLSFSEIEQIMRYEILTMRRQTECNDYDMTTLYSKYVTVVHSRRDDHGFMLNPVYTGLRAWESADAWADVVLAGHTWIHLEDDGRLIHFVTESHHGMSAAFAELGIVMRYNTRKMIPELLNCDNEWTEMTDQIESFLRETVAATFHFPRKARLKGQTPGSPARWSRQNWQSALDATLSDIHVDPFIDWIEKLPRWDTMPRLDNWIVEAGLVPSPDIHPDLLAWACRTILLVACRRAHDPGFKHDTIPVLVGPQGCGKSTALAHLLPPHHRNDWFSDSLKFSSDDRRRVEAIQGAVIVEASEMSGATSAELESLKAFLSRTNDRIRLAYRRNPEALPRLASIVGTSNGYSVLPNDPTGNRRFLAVPITSGNTHHIRSYLDKNRNQLWAEAWVRAKANEDTYMPPELANQQAEINEDYRSNDEILETACAAFLYQRTETHASFNPNSAEARKLQTFTIDEVVRSIRLVDDTDAPVTVNPREQHRIARALLQLGCQRKRVRKGQKLIRIWNIPE